MKGQTLEFTADLPLTDNVNYSRYFFSSWPVENKDGSTVQIQVPGILTKKVSHRKQCLVTVRRQYVVSLSLKKHCSTHFSSLPFTDTLFCFELVVCALNCGVF